MKSYHKLLMCCTILSISLLSSLTASAQSSDSCNEHSAFTYFERGSYAYLDKDYERAIDEYTCAIQRNPDNAPAYGYRGTSHFKLSQYDEALADYDAAIELDST